MAAKNWGDRVQVWTLSGVCKMIIRSLYIRVSVGSNNHFRAYGRNRSFSTEL